MPAPAEHTKCSRNRGDACPRRRARRRGAWWLLAFILAPLSLQASAADDAATVLALRGAVIVTDEEGQRRKLEEGDTVSSGDEIETARRSWIRLEFTDGSRFDLGANTQFRVDDNAVEVANAFGSVVLDEAGYGTEIPDANSPPSPPRRMRLRSITNLTRTLQSVGRIRLP